MLRIAITGSRGFVGTHLVNKIREQGRDFYIIEIDFDLGYDITDYNSLKNIQPFDVLVHLAAKSFVPDSYNDPTSFYKTNVIGTLNALELCRKYNAKMIYTSSYVYGNPEYIPIDEKHPVKAFNPYAQSKLMGEDLCMAYYRDFGVPFLILRPFNIYGKGQNENFLIASIAKQALSGIVNLKDPEPKRDYVFIDDVVEAYIKAIKYQNSTIDIFNIGSGVSISILELTKIISRNYNKELEINFSRERRKNEILEIRADISKAKKILKWKPNVSVEKGIVSIIKG